MASRVASRHVDALQSDHIWTLAHCILLDARQRASMLTLLEARQRASTRSV